MAHPAGRRRSPPSGHFDASGSRPVAGFYPWTTNQSYHRRAWPPRLCLERPDVFRVQLQAQRGRPTVTNPQSDVSTAVHDAAGWSSPPALAQAVDQLQVESVPAALPEIGVMVEVPVAALAIDQFDAAFLSIGSNDLAHALTTLDHCRALAGISGHCSPAVFGRPSSISSTAPRRKPGVLSACAATWPAILVVWPAFSRADYASCRLIHRRLR